MRIVVPPGGRRRWNRAGPGRSTDRTKVTGVVAPVGRAYLDLALSLCLSLSSPLLFTPLLRRIHTNTHTHTHTSRTVHSSVPYRSFGTNERILCRFSPPFPSPRLTSPRLVSLLRSPHPLARCLGFANLATPCFHRLSLALTLTLSQTNVGFVVYTAGCTESNFVSFSL